MSVKKLVFLVALVAVLASSCAGERPLVPYEDLYSHAEVSLEREGYLTLRALTVPYSYSRIVDYRLRKVAGENSDSFYVTLLKGSVKERPSLALRSVGPELEVLMPVDSVNSDAVRVYYQDDAGVYPMVIGTATSWREYLHTRRTTGLDGDED